MIERSRPRARQADSARKRSAAACPLLAFLPAAQTRRGMLDPVRGPLSPARQILSELLEDDPLLSPTGAAVPVVGGAPSGEAVNTEGNGDGGVISSSSNSSNLSTGGRKALERARVARMASPPPCELAHAASATGVEIEAAPATVDDDEYWGISGIIETFNDSSDCTREGSPESSIARSRNGDLWSAPRQASMKRGSRNEGVRREVRVRVIVDRVTEINLHGQTFSANLFLEASWLEPDFRRFEPFISEMEEVPIVSQDESHQRRGILRVEEIEHDFFAPRLWFVNRIDKGVQDSTGAHEGEEWFQVFHSSPLAAPHIVCYRWKLHGVFQELMELEYFPFDVQDLTMTLRSGWEENHVTNAVSLVKNQSARYQSFCNTKGFVQAAEYVLHSRINFDKDETSADESASKYVYPQIHIRMRVDRKAQ